MARRTNTVKNSVLPTMPGRNGGKLLAGGKPGNKGGTGRPPDEFKEAMAQLASRAERLATLETILSDPSHQYFMAALKHCTEYGYGKAKDTQEVKGDVTVRVVYSHE